MAFVLIVAQL